MSEKTISFIEAFKSQQAEILPIEKEEIIKNLDSIPEEIQQDYIQILGRSAEEILTFRNIISLSKMPKARSYLIDSLDECMLSRLASIAKCMASRDVLNKINELLENTFGYSVQSEESIARGKDMLLLIKKFKGNYKSKGIELASRAKKLIKLADFFQIMNLGEQFHSIIVDCVSEFQESEFNEIFSLAKKIVN
jgi:hypothetical protein